MRIDTHRAGLRGTVKLLAVLASIPFAAQGTKAAFPGANGKIAFNCSGVICVVAPLRHMPQTSGGIDYIGDAQAPRLHRRRLGW